MASLALTTTLYGCGNEAKIDRADADAVLAALDGVDRAFADGRCDVANTRSAAVGRQVDELPSGTDRELRLALQRSADRLATLVARQCEQSQESEPTAPVPDVTAPEPIEPEKEKKEKNKGKDKDGENPGNGDAPPSDEQPPVEEPAPGDDDSGGVAPDEDGVLE